MLVNIGFIAFGLVGLFLGGDWLVKGSSRVAGSFGISTLIIGLTIVAFGTSAPELLVNLNAAISGSTELAMGNIIGSNIANIGLILGLTGLIVPIKVDTVLVRREIPLMIGISVVVYLLTLDGVLGRVDGLVLVLGFVAFNGLFYYLSRHESADHEDEKEAFKQYNRTVEIGRLLLGIFILVVGARFTVMGATAIARSVGISELVIGLTLIAFGTSLPELAASVVSAVRGETDITVGNVIGSNISNLLAILGITAIVQPIPVSMAIRTFEFPVMLAFSLLLLPFALDRILSRYEATAFMIAYFAFIAFSFFRG